MSFTEVARVTSDGFHFSTSPSLLPSLPPFTFSFLFRHGLTTSSNASNMKVRNWDIDIDRWLNHYIPRNQLSKLPRPVSRFLGYRDKPHYEVGNVLVAWWACVGAFVGVVIIEAVLMIPAINNLGVPVVIASFVSFPRGIEARAKLIQNRVQLRSLSTTSFHRLWPSLAIPCLDISSPPWSASASRSFSCSIRISRTYGGSPALCHAGWRRR